MSHEASPPAHAKSSHALAWTLVLIVVLPILYLLSVPPVLCLMVRAQSLSVVIEQPEWYRYYSMPNTWAHNHTPLKEPLTVYTEWVLEKMLPPLKITP